MARAKRPPENERYSHRVELKREISEEEKLHRFLVILGKSGKAGPWMIRVMTEAMEHELADAPADVWR
jgi:hypothetical protein